MGVCEERDAYMTNVDKSRSGRGELAGTIPADSGARSESDSVDEIKRLVQERLNQEAEMEPPAEEKPVMNSQFIDDCLFANALGDGTMYATLFRDRFLYCKNTQEWFEWTGHHWERDIMGRALAAVETVVQQYLDEYKKVAGRIAGLVGDDGEEGQAKIKKLQKKQRDLLNRASKLRDDRRRNTCLTFSHTIENPLAIKGDEFDQKPMLFPCGNGVVDLERGKLIPGRPGDYLSLASPIDFLGIDAPAPLWEEKVLEIFSGDQDVVDYVQRLFGYAITGMVHEKVFPVLYGKGGWNGRSLIVETISYVMGSLAGSIPSEMLLSSKFVKAASGPSPDIMSLKGLRMTFASETDEGQKFSASKVKWLTGKDELTGRNPHDKYPSRFPPTHKLFLMTNTQPQAPPNDKAFWERLHLIPFTLSFVNRDPQDESERRAILDLDQQLLKEVSGILAWLVRGCLLWQKHGLKPPLKVTEATEQYRRNEDLLADFIDSCCIREPGAMGQSSTLYNRFITWYHENIGEKHPSGTWFGKQLSQKYEKTRSGGCIHYIGIELPKVES